MAKNTTHLVLILVLIVLFLGILFASTANRSLEINYHFNEKIIVDFIPEYYSKNNIELGTLNIENNGLLPSKIKLKNYFICSFDPYFKNRHFELEYRGKIIKGSNDFLYDDYNSKYVEVLAGEKINLAIIPRIYSHEFRYDLNADTFLNKTFDFYLYESEEKYISWEICNDLSIDMAEKKIEITFNIENKPFEYENFK